MSGFSNKCSHSSIITWKSCCLKNRIRAAMGPTRQFPRSIFPPTLQLSSTAAPASLKSPETCHAAVSAAAPGSVSVGRSERLGHYADDWPGQVRHFDPEPDISRWLHSCGTLSQELSEWKRHQIGWTLSRPGNVDHPANQ